MVLLNIGLNASLANGGEPFTYPAGFVDAYAAYKLNAHALGVQQSASEETALYAIEGGMTNTLRARIDRLAHALRQDCIAAFDTETGRGELIGPRAAAWGDFNPEYFLTAPGFDRARLSGGAA